MKLWRRRDWLAKKTHKLCSQQIHFSFDCVFNDNDIAIKLISLMRIKKLNAVVVYLPRELELWNTAIVSSCSTWKRVATGTLTFMQLGLVEVWWKVLKRSTSSDFLAFELKAIPLSFNNSFKTATVIFSAGPCFIRSYLSRFPFL